ncbi:conserved hypothetical protein [Ferroglobus placidus DSM 10642]|uniref:H/ACA RNA-protein complex component Gar1 n=1 Tax=Ferroglobus placidus (strain DSM 10642 / AEDII12DO) TaxID=589924 RepID=D3RYH8_FERPA|nr:Gar1/Naf1 family protein [Ferroglobus placidus]ADC65541.1 conserved hypothetical protein [Ferroglobus placidus DSM 10642]
MLKRIGIVAKISKTGNIIVKAEYVPKIGADVVDKRLRKIGYVYDVIGPVSQPYVVVRPKDKNPDLSGSELFVVIEDGRGGKGKGKGGRKKGGRKGEGSRKGRNR